MCVVHPPIPSAFSKLRGLLFINFFYKDNLSIHLASQDTRDDR